MKKLIFNLYFFIFISCSSQKGDNVIVTINNKGNFYFKNDKLMAITSFKNDSISFKYKDTLLLKIEKYKADKLINEASFIYDLNNKISDDYIFPEDYYNYYEKFYTRIPYKNKYKLLDRDFVYIDTILDEVQDWKKYSNNKKKIEIFEFNLNENVRMLNAKFSPFIYGTTLKKLKLYVVDNFLIEMDANLIEEPGGEIIYYKKYYKYDKAGRLSSCKTINSLSGEIEDEDKIDYKEWCVYP